MRAREGFSMLELVVVILIVGIVAAITIPNMTQGMGRSRAQRAATVIASDLRLAHSMAARQRTPVTIVIDASNKVIRLRDFTNTSRIYSERYFTTSSELPVQTLTTSAATVTAFPNGLLDGTLQVTVNVSGQRRIVSMSRVGMVRITSP